MEIYHLKIIVVSAVGIHVDPAPETIVKFQTKRNEPMKTREYGRSLHPFWCDQFDCLVHEGEEIIFRLEKTNGKELGVAQLIVPHMYKGETSRHKLNMELGRVLTVKLICDDIEKKEN